MDKIVRKDDLMTFHKKLKDLLDGAHQVGAVIAVDVNAFDLRMCVTLSACCGYPRTGYRPMWRHYAKAF